MLNVWDVSWRQKKVRIKQEYFFFISYNIFDNDLINIEQKVLRMLIFHVYMRQLTRILANDKVRNKRN